MAQKIDHSKFLTKSKLKNFSQVSFIKYIYHVQISKQPIRNLK